MKKMTFMLSVLTLAVGTSLVWSADEPSAAQPAAPSAVGSPSSPSNPGNQAMAPAQTPPADWTQLSGTVQAVDSQAKTIDLKDQTGQVYSVPVDRQVRIEKDGKRVALTHVQAGDTITLAKRMTSSSDGSHTY